jgi:hypothetical protein
VGLLPLLSRLLLLLLLLLLLQVGAGFYVNATVDKWKNWRMYDYITKVRPAPSVVCTLPSHCLLHKVRPASEVINTSPPHTVCCATREASARKA